MIPDYAPAFEETDAPFMFYYRFGVNGGYEKFSFTRGEFLSLARKAQEMFCNNGCGRGARVSSFQYDRLVAPTVSRHFDFLDGLDTSDSLPVSPDRLKRAMSKIDFLIGSAPVGPKTVNCLKRFSGRTPVFRFGSTETCLQVMGIPHWMNEENCLDNFNKGWRHHIDGEAFPGYYVGRPHPPYTEVRVVKSVDRKSSGFLEEVPPGEPGYLIVRGGNVMKGYVGGSDRDTGRFRGGLVFRTQGHLFLFDK